MANSLGKDGLEGKTVILDFAEYNKGGCTKDPKTRAFLCTGGFGCDNFTHGRAIFGKFLMDGEEARVDGYSLKRLATDKEAKEWFEDSIKRGVMNRESATKVEA